MRRLRERIALWLAPWLTPPAYTGTTTYHFHVTNLDTTQASLPEDGVRP